MAKNYTMTKEEKETVLHYNQTQEPVTIWGYDPSLLRRLAKYSEQYPEVCKRVDKRKYRDYFEYEIQKDRVSIRLLPPMSEEQKQAASEKAKRQGLGKKQKIESSTSTTKGIDQ